MLEALQKHHQIPDKFKELKTQLNTDFQFLKEVTSKNFDNLQQTLNLQQSYSAALYGHLNLLYSKLAKIETQLQSNCKHIPSNRDEVQINAPEYDPVIDGPIAPGRQQTSNSAVVSVEEILIPSDSVSIDTLITEEDITITELPEDSVSISEDTHQSLNPSQQISGHQEFHISPTVEPNSQSYHNPLKKYHN